MCCMLIRLVSDCAVLRNSINFMFPICSRTRTAKEALNVAKRGTNVPQGEGVSVITFEEDL
jgi:hypothetical protein